MGWLRSVRFQKKRAFAHVDDGSVAAGLQVLLQPETTTSFDELRAQLGNGCSVRVTGTVQPSPAKGQDWELVATGVELVGTCDDTYPLQKKWHSPEFLRSIAHLRPRTKGGGAVARVRSALALSTHEFFGHRGFLHVHTPILTSCDAEGGGETFEVLPSQQVGADKASDTAAGEASDAGDLAPHFFGQRAYLTVSGQLHGEALAMAHGDVYTFGPCFRAEASHTTRHLAELWMLEPEMAWANLDDAVNLAEDYCKTTLRSLLQHHADDLELLQAVNAQQQQQEQQQQQAGAAGVNGHDLLREIESVCSSEPWSQITYREAISLLQDAEARRPGRFAASGGAPSWGDDLGAEHERFLCRAVAEGSGSSGNGDTNGSPVVVRDYPRELKAFYMRRNNDGETVTAMDVLFPRLAEVVGGGQREERLPLLLANMQAQATQSHHDQEPNRSASHTERQLEWYSDLRRYGSVPHAGWGAGFDRLVQFATGKDNIRDVTAFPRTRGTALA
jgi:asparaginyl-tRNA synthetase